MTVSVVDTARAAQKLVWAEETWEALPTGHSQGLSWAWAVAVSEPPHVLLPFQSAAVC